MVFASARAGDVEGVATALGLGASRPQDDATPRGAAVRRAREAVVRFVLPRREWVWLPVLAAVLAVHPLVTVILGAWTGHYLAVGAIATAVALGIVVGARAAVRLIPPLVVQLEPNSLRRDGVPIPLADLRAIAVRSQGWRAAVAAVADDGRRWPVGTDLRREHAEAMAIDLAEALRVEVRGLGRGSPTVPTRGAAMELREEVDSRQLSVWSGVRPRDAVLALVAGLGVPVLLALQGGWSGAFGPAILVVLGVFPVPRRWELKFSPHGLEARWTVVPGWSGVERIGAAELLPARLVHDAGGAPVLVLRSASGTQIELLRRPVAELHRVASWIEEVRACAQREPAGGSTRSPAALRALHALRAQQGRD
jgi:hypothetical protein